MAARDDAVIYERIDPTNVAEVIADCRRNGFEWELIRTLKETRRREDGTRETVYRWVLVAWPANPPDPAEPQKDAA